MSIKKHISFFLFALSLQLLDSSVMAQQLKLGNNPTQVEKSAVLQLESRNQGLLLPRLADTIAITALNPRDGTLIYLDKVPHEGVYVYQAGHWQQANQWYQTSAEDDNLLFSRVLDTITLNIPDASERRGMVNTSTQAFNNNKIFEDSVVAISAFSAQADAKITDNLVLKKLQKIQPGYLLSTDEKGKAILQTHPLTWIVGGNTIPAGAPDSLGTTNEKDLSFFTDNKERMRITADGKAGIGSNGAGTINRDSITDMLTVNGSFKLGKEGSHFEAMGEATADIVNYLQQINILDILQIPLPDKVGSHTFTINVPGVKKNALLIVNPANDWNNLYMELSILATHLPLGETRVSIEWARSSDDGLVDIGLLFHFRGINLTPILVLLGFGTLKYSSDPIKLNILYCNPKN